MEKITVLSLGGSLIVPKKINFGFLKKFKKTILNNSKNQKFIIVCGGGAAARKKINKLKKQNKSIKLQALAGIEATRQNANTLIKIFNNKSNKLLLRNMQEIKSQLKYHRIIICGALRYHENETSDGTAAKLAANFKTNFINLTNVSGLYNKNPKTSKNAKLIKKISWKNFEEIAKKIPYKPGQHFVLDQQAASIIKKHKIRTYIIGKNLKNLENFLRNKKFIGTTIKND